MGRIIEFGSMLFLGMLLIIAMTHFLNGTLITWTLSKFSSKPLDEKIMKKKEFKTP